MPSEKLVDQLRSRSESVQAEVSAEQRSAERREQRRIGKHTREYIAKHQGQLILELAQRAEEAAEQGGTNASIRHTVGADDNQGLRKTMNGVKEHFVNEGFDAQTTYSDNFHYEYFGSDGETPVDATRFTHGVEISWKHEE